MKKIFIIFIVLFVSGLSAMSKEEVARLKGWPTPYALEQWVVSNKPLLLILADRNGTFAEKNNALEVQGLKNLSDHDYVVELPGTYERIFQGIENARLVAKIPSEETLFGIFVRQLGYKNALTIEENDALRQAFALNIGLTYQGMSQVWAFDRIRDALKAGELKPSIIIPRTLPYFYPIPIQWTNVVSVVPLLGTVPLNDSTAFVVQEYVPHEEMTNAEVAQLTLEELKDIVRYSLVGEICTLFKSSNPEDLSNIGRTEDGKLVIANLERPNASLKESTLDVLVLKNFENLAIVLSQMNEQSSSALMGWMWQEFGLTGRTSGYARDFLFSIVPKYSNIVFARTVQKD